MILIDLDQGEAEAIALALELDIEQILLDERDGRMVAKAMGLAPVGVLGILLRAKREGALDSVRQVMTSLQQEAGFYIDENLFEAVLAEAGEG